ncbi:MAG: CRP-like cAMP-binding protein [Gammaproteobacteria bacterium]
MNVPSSKNRIIENLPSQKRHLFVQRCDRVNLSNGMRLCEAGRPLSHVFFPLTASISIVQKNQDQQELELGLIGNEGMLGGTLVLGVSDAPQNAVVCGAGLALRMTTVLMRDEMHTNVALVNAMQRHVYAKFAQMSRTAACAHFHEVEARLARRLCMAHDRTDGDHFRLTQQFLADILGVQRSSVNIAAGVLKHRELIKFNRGEIKVVSRSGLEAAACECYHADC